MNDVANVPSQYDFEIWDKTYSPDFVDINLKSRVPEKWMNLYYVLADAKYSDSIIKPINGYAKNFGVMPRLISIVDNIVTLRQYNHAEIYLLVKDGSVVTMDRPWVRQYYRSSEPFECPDECFPDQYAFYMPWKIDEDLELLVTSSGEDSPVHVFDKKIINTKIDQSVRHVSSPLIPFYFKSVGTHMVNTEYGRIRLDSPIFDIVFKANDELVEKIKALYGKED